MNEAPSGESKSDWLKVAEDSFKASTNYLDSNLRKTFERNIALYQSRHPVGSKYNSATYKSRSRLFRPKTKSTVRKNEAAAAAAFFANVDVVTVEAENDADQMQVISAELMNEILNYRLTKTIPWFVTVMGAVQEAQVIGVVGSYQYWHYKEQEGEPVPMMGEDGQPLTNEKGEGLAEQGPPEIVIDKPCIELMPIENYRFDPAADWTDVVNSSPYFIRMVPMYVDDVKQRMKEKDSKTGQPKWKKLDDGEIRQAMVDYESIRQQREQKQDPLVENTESLKEFDVVWTHENFVRLDGKEWVYWTLGTQYMLSEPVPLKKAYFHGERPFVIGVAVIEAHKAIPDSLVGIGSELQREVNETVNQRRDNVSLVLNKRYIVKRGAQVDTDSLLRNVPGAVTLANNPEEDVKEMNWPDVTASAYQEQDRLNVDFDELTGNFSQSSVQTNRKLNETVGGMNLMNSSAGQMTEYLLRTVVETWMEKVLYQVVKLEQAYETDEVILGLAGQKAKLAQKYGINQITDDMLNGSLTVRVSMGVGATDPQKKLGRFLAALHAGGEAMQILPNANQEAIWNEIMGLAGYKGGSRFFEPSGPNQMLMQQMQEMKQALAEAQQKAAQAEASAIQGKVAVAKAQYEAAAVKGQADQAIRQAQMEKGVVQAKSEIDRAHGQIRETILKNQPPAKAEPVDIKPYLERIKVEQDKANLDKDKANAILQVQNAELQAELKLTKAGATLDKQQLQIGHTVEKANIESQAKDKVAKAETTAHDVKQDAKHKETAKEQSKDTGAEVVKHVKELKAIVTAPKELVRDAEGKATHVKQGDKLTPIKRDDNGRIVGL